VKCCVTLPVPFSTFIPSEVGINLFLSFIDLIMKKS
jgi:hypothetical protein